MNGNRNTCIGVVLCIVRLTLTCRINCLIFSITAIFRPDALKKIFLLPIYKQQAIEDTISRRFSRGFRRWIIEPG